jgi:hypothetical protein
MEPSFASWQEGCSPYPGGEKEDPMTIRILLVPIFLAAAGLPQSRGAAPETPPAETPGSGTILRLDAAKGQIVFRPAEDAAAERTIYWNEATRFEGEPLREGAVFAFRTVPAQDRAMATWIKVERLLAPSPPPAAHGQSPFDATCRAPAVEWPYDPDVSDVFVRTR